MSAVYQLKDIKASFAGREVLNISELSIEQGECIALLGQNGAGKSTLLNILAFLTQPQQGFISLFGSAVNQTLPPKLRSRIGYVNQQPYPLSGSVEQNLRLALTLQGIKEQSQTRIDKALMLTNTRHLAKQKASTLSGGELRRMAIARAIVYQPDVLLLDEPFSHLDTTSANELEKVIELLKNSGEITIVFSTHNQLQGLSLATRTLSLVNGRLSKTPLLNLFNGTTKEGHFNTGKISVETTQSIDNARHIAIHPNDIVLSLTPFNNTSMRNQFSGEVILIAAEETTVRIEIDCGERFQTIISRESHNHLNIQLGDSVWLGFKASAVELF
jgi:molybdopterin-binding protein